MRLDFVCVGPQRTGTSWMDAALRGHPEVQLPERVKETFFFDENRENGIDWYEAQFGRRHGRRRGEIAPTYFTSRGAFDAIVGLDGPPLIIVCVRQPVARAISSFHHHVRAGRVPSGSIRAAAELMPGIVEDSRYSTYLPLWQEAFGTSRVLTIATDTIDLDPSAAWDRLCRFLEIDVIQLTPLPDRTYLGATSEMPRYPAVARSASVLARRLRSVGMHSVVNIGKRSGLKRVFRGGGTYPDIGESDLAWLRQTLAEDTAYVADLLKRDS